MTRTPNRRRRRSAHAVGAAATVAGIAGSALAALRQRRRRRVAETAEREWRCACGQDFRLAGIGRHRVYWVAGAPKSEPIMSGRCPRCDRPLPA